MKMMKAIAVLGVLLHVANAQLTSPVAEAWTDGVFTLMTSPTSCFSGTNNVNPCSCNFSSRSVTCSGGNIITMTLFRNGFSGTFPVDDINTIISEGATSIDLSNVQSGGAVGTANTFEYPSGFSCLAIDACNTDPNSCAVLDLTNVQNGAGDQLVFCTPAPTANPTVTPTASPTAPTAAPTNTPPSPYPTVAPTPHCSSLTVTNDSPKATVVAASTNAGDRFGSSVAVDGNFMIVGAKFDELGSYRAGTITIFENIVGTWTEVFSFAGSSNNDLVGVEVSISGTYAMAGVPRMDNSGANSGGGYVFFYDGSNWALQETLVPSDATARDYCGRSVAITDTYAVMGCPRDNRFGLRVGSFAAYKRSGVTWSYLGAFGPNSPAVEGQCGKAIAISGNTVILGCPKKNRAYAFDLDNTVPSGSVQTKRFNPAGLVGVADFGKSVAISADLTVVIGAPNQVYMGWVGAGKVYVYYLQGGTYNLAGSFGVENPYMGDNFGKSVAIDANTILVGAYKDNFSMNSRDRGSVTLLQGNLDKWRRTNKILGNSAFDMFGLSVAVSGTSIAMGEPQSDDNGADGGGVTAMTLDAPADCP